MARSRQLQLLGMDNEEIVAREEAKELFVFGYDFTIAPLMDLALSTGDTDVMKCAILYALSYSRQRQLFGLAKDPDEDEKVDSVDKQIASFIKTVYEKLVEKLLARCQEHDFTVYFELLDLSRQDQYLGTGVFTDSQVFIGLVSQKCN